MKSQLLALNRALVSLFLIAHISFAGPVSGENSYHGTRLATKVQQAISEALSGHSYSIDVEAKGGTVILSGVADSEHARDVAIDVARSQPEIARVIDRIEVSTLSNQSLGSLSGSKQQISDSQIKEKLEQAFRQSNLPLALDKIEVLVKNGNVTILGDLPRFQEVDKALSLALMIDGVRDVKSEITINGNPYPSFSR